MVIPVTQQLPKSLLDLIEHVELTKSGWWDVALGNVLLAATWVHGKPVHREEVNELVLSAFNLEIPPDRIRISIERLINQGKLRVHETDQVTPAADVATQMDTRLKDAQSNENIVRAAFVENIANCCAPHSPEEAWALFMERYFLPIIDLLGVRTLHLLSGDGTDDASVAALTDDFLEQFDTSNRANIRTAIGRFLSPDDVDVRRYVTEHLDAMFLVRASGLSNDAIAGINKLGQRQPTFRLFLDTNFLFSILDLHEDPSNESAQILGKMIQQVGKHLTIRMNVTQPTMEEIKRTLRAFQASLSGIRMTTSMADAVLEVGVSGIAMRFARANRETGPISAQDYFRPFLNDLIPILRSKGVEVYNERLDQYRQRQDVVDDLHQMVNLDGESENERQRKYNAALHDSILWHVVQDRRPAVFESPLEAVHWVVTNDYGLLSFDRRRQRILRSAAGVCIHPAELVQMLRLWEPRSTDMEQALLSGLRLPFMFYGFDSGKEDASMRILKALSRFEHIRYLDPEVIRDIVLSDAVRQKTSAARTEEEENQIIREALLDEHKDIIDERDAALRRATVAEQALAREREVTLSNIDAQQSKEEEATERIAELESELQTARSETKFVNSRVMNLELLLNERQYAERVRSAKIRFTLFRSVGIVLLTVLTISLGIGWLAVGGGNIWLTLLSLLGGWILGVFFVVTTRVRNPDILEWRPAKWLIEQRHEAIWWIRALIAGVVGSAIAQVAMSGQFFT